MANQKSSIIELTQKLKEIYPVGYIIKDREFRAWKALLRHAGCIKITPFEKEDSELQFWTRSKDPDKDKDTLIQLYNCRFLQTNPEKPYKAILECISRCIR
ncbi:unnamed protein product [Rhizophagus irregularis]|nr:unnamed protein product [Rhizophagus irregularis]